MKLAALFALLLICMGLAFGYPLIAENKDLAEIALIIGFFGAIVDFVCILIFIFKMQEEKKQEEEK